jgi:HNH endonuclease
MPGNKTGRIKDDLDVFETKVLIGDECWPWLGKIVGRYGRTTTTIAGVQKHRLPHRVMWELMRGPIPEGLTVDHLCANALCMNPGHMELVTPGENTRRANIRTPRPRDPITQRFLSA